MKHQIQTRILLAFVPAVTLVFTSCSSTPQGERATLVAAEKGVPGGVLVDTYKITATVTSVDPVARKVTLVTRDGKKSEFKAGPEVVNFPQIRVGDQVRAKLTEQLVVFMASDSPPQTEGTAGVVALAPVGAKPGAFVADTMQIKAKVTAIDLKKRKATLQFPDGTSKKVAVRKDVDLTARSVGEEVIIRATETLAITVEKP